MTRASRCLAAAAALAALIATTATHAATAQLTPAQARIIVAPLYDALNEPSKKDVPALLAQATNAYYLSCSTETDCLNRSDLAAQFESFGAIIPDLHWKILDLWVSGDRIIVLGQATGTPAKTFFGVEPTGKSFTTIALDSFEVRDGKLASAFHIENWVAAMEQVRGR